MAKTGSYIKLDRGLKKNSMWLEKPFSKGQAWVDLLLLTQGIDREKSYRGVVQQQKSGVVYTSILYLSKRWGWYRARVYRFLENLIDLGMIEIQGWTRNDTHNDTRNSTKNSTTNGTIISIVNWAFYQDCDTNDDTNNDTRNDTQNDTRNDTHNRKHIIERNKEKAIKNKKGRSAPNSLPREIDDIVPERDLDGYPDFEHMPSMYEGTKRDIPPRVRSLFNSQYDAYWRYMERCSTK